MTDDINYYGMQLKLREYEEQLLNEKNTKKLEFLILETKTFIFEYEILKEEYLNRLKEFYKTSQTEEYKQEANAAYEKVIEFVTKEVILKKREINYNYKNDMIPIFNVEVKNKSNSRYFTDNPLYYIYPSVIAANAELTGVFFLNQIVNFLKLNIT